MLCPDREYAREYTDARVLALETMCERLMDPGRVSALEHREAIREAQGDTESQVTQMHDSSDDSSSPDSPESAIGLIENLSVDAVQL